MKHIKKYINENENRFIDELLELLRIPSISADPFYKQDVLKCAELVATSIKRAGAENIEICKTSGYPIVYGEKIIDINLPTVLVYGHYDVQPADPLIYGKVARLDLLSENRYSPRWSYFC